jgi:hypothetical protein
MIGVAAVLNPGPGTWCKDSSADEELAHHIIHLVCDVAWCLLFLGLAVSAFASMTNHTAPMLLLGAAVESCLWASSACNHAARVLLLVLVLHVTQCGDGLSDRKCSGRLLSLQHNSGLHAMLRCCCL